MIKLWSKLNVLVNTSCTFLCDKLFHRPEINFRPSNNDSSECYGKRMKLNDGHWRANDIDSMEPPCLVSMQKEHIEISDDEDECHVIAELPRRKKAGSSLKLILSPKSVPSKQELKNNEPWSTFTFKKPDDDQKEIEQVKVMCNNSGKDGISKSNIRCNKFFNNQRTSLDHGKVMKFRSFKNQFRRRMNFLQESFRLAEKLTYLRLLQSHTSCNLIKPKSSFKPIGYEVKPIPVIDLTDDKSNAGDDKSQLEVQRNSSEDQDVLVLKEISAAKSLKDILKKKAINSDDDIWKIMPSPSNNNFRLVSLEDPTSENVISLSDDDEEEGDSNPNSNSEPLEERLRNFMQISGPVVVEVENDVNEQYSLPDLTPEQEERIRRALVPYPSHEVLSQGFNLQITRRDIQTLKGLNWLNDEVINFYMNLIMERSKLNKTLPKVYAFNTFFYPKLQSSGYSSLRRWTKHVDIFSYDLLLVPIHLGMHWCMSLIDFRSKSVQYYDSVGSPNNACLEILLVYLKAEYLDKKNKTFSTIEWKKSNVEDIPQQMNGSDCGVFSCMFAEHLARDCALLFTQNDMPYFRKKMIIEILEKRLLT